MASLIHFGTRFLDAYQLPIHSSSVHCNRLIPGPNACSSKPKPSSWLRDGITMRRVGCAVIAICTDVFKYLFFNCTRPNNEWLFAIYLPCFRIHVSPKSKLVLLLCVCEYQLLVQFSPMWPIEFFVLNCLDITRCTQSWLTFFFRRPEQAYRKPIVSAFSYPQRLTGLF